MTDTLDVTIRRVIAAPPAKLFEAWTTPALLRAWFGPKGVECVAAEVDLRVGGEYRLGNKLPDGRVVWITGTFEMIEPPTKLVYSWRLGDEVSRVTVRFEPFEQGSTEVVVCHERIESEAIRDGHDRGWVECLQGLWNWALATR